MLNIRKFGEYIPNIGKRVFIDPMAVVIGNVELADDVSIWPMVSVRGDLLKIKIGARSNIQDNSTLHTTRTDKKNKKAGFALSIGEDVTVGHNVILHGCTIKNKVLIGIGSIVLDGATIESNVVVGAGSVVAPGKTLESGFLYLGSPARRVRELKQEEIDFLTQSTSNYLVTKDEHIAMGYAPAL